MTRTVVKGWYYDPATEARFTKGWALLDGPRLIETGKASTSPPKCKAVNGIALPALPNAHTHLGDFLLKDKVRPGMTVEELVAPPDGLKHKLLSKVDTVDSISGALQVLRTAGVGPFCDFREGGISGVEAMARALVTSGHGLRATILGRPKGLRFDREEVDAILSICDGIGASAVRDWDHGELSALASHVRRKGKVFALHASEAVREDLDGILDMDPQFLVHMVKGTPSDFHRLSVLGIPVVVCPRSNAYFGLQPPVKAMLKAGVQVCLGTDNAMLTDLSVLGELSAARSLGLTALEAWGLIESSWKLLNRKDLLHNNGPANGWTIVEMVTEGPLKALTEAGPKARVV
jgi:cytosine/adenosine deaminase-related metal-dependent hydrolase